MELSLYQNIIHHRTYAREKGDRLETYQETTDRYINYLKSKFTNHQIKQKIEECGEMIYLQKNAPSMRLFFSAGQAVEAENAMAFNCKYQSINTLKSFADLLYSLLCTCGVGVSVESKFIEQLPKIPSKIELSEETILVDDSRYGWADALQTYLNKLFLDGVSLKFDTKFVRSKGSPLRTSGGYASGAEPFNQLREFIENLVVNKKEKTLTSVDCFDIVCMIAQCAVQGGVRRAAIITLFDETDDAMFDVKSVENLQKYPHRYSSNNTMVYSGKDSNYLLKAIYGAKINGEPGILFEENINRKMNKLGRFSDDGWGVNPCGEVVLRPNQFCNLTEAIIREDDTIEDILIKVECATYLALLQATLTDYHFISEEAKINQETDPIIGVSLTGLCDNVKFNFRSEKLEEYLTILKNKVNETVDKYWQYIGLKQRPKGLTCIKPSGTVSQIVNSSSGVHPRYSKYYIRRVLIGSDSSLYKSLADAGIPFLEFDGVDGRVFEFPIQSPKNCIVTNDMTALDQLEYVTKINKYWCDFNASVTIYVKKHEWFDVYNFLKYNKETIAVSFLPYESSVDTTGFLYLVYEEIDQVEFEKRNQNFINIKWSDIINENTKDTLAKHQEFACSGGVCSI